MTIPLFFSHRLLLVALPFLLFPLLYCLFPKLVPLNHLILYSSSLTLTFFLSSYSSSYFYRTCLWLVLLHDLTKTSVKIQRIYRPFRSCYSSKLCTLSGASVVVGAGVVVTGPQTASFLYVQYFLNQSNKIRRGIRPHLPLLWLSSVKRMIICYYSFDTNTMLFTWCSAIYW